MRNKLFLICPFSCLENILQAKYGNDIYFLTSLGAIFQFDEIEYVSELKSFIIREQIKEIYIVNETSCKFINGVINKNKQYGLKSEKLIEKLYLENYFLDFKNQPKLVQQNKLAELNILNQANSLMNSSLLKSFIVEFDIVINGLITNKEIELFQEIKISNNR